MLTVERFNSKDLFGYEQITTFYEDFSIADNFGIEAIKDTYKRAFEAWKDNYKYLTELVMVLNWKIWRWHGKNNDYAKLYDELWRDTDEYACINLTGDELTYFYRTTD